MTRQTLYLTAALLVAGLAGTAPPGVPAAHAQELGTLRFREGALSKAYQARRDSLIDFYANQVSPDDYSAGGYIHVAADLYRGTDVDWAMARLDSLGQNPRGDMFWMTPFVATMYAGRDALPEEARRKMRDLWRTYMPYRGDTENHWAMYYASLYLAAQMYPDDPAETWYTGKSAQENMAEAKEYLLHWMDLTTTIGQGEYDSPHYILVYVAPMALLYGFADDPEMRQRAGMMLDYIIADYLAESLGGLYGGAHSRIYEREVIAPYRLGVSRLAWLAFGTVPFMPGWETFILAISGYEPPPILHHIAVDRQEPFVHIEGKRTRHRFRHSKIKNAPVYKYNMVRPEYILGSSQGGLLQPIQQQTWDLMWAVDDPRETRNTLFSLHPYSSPVELTMYFAELPDFITEIVVRSKTEYDSPDKLTGGSPYEQVFQHRDALVALYDVEPGIKFPHVSAFFSNDLEGRVEDPSGWIFARGGDALIAYYPLAPYTWKPVVDVWDESIRHDRLESPHLKNGAVLQVAPASAFDSFEAFKEAVRALPLETSTRPTPSVRFTTLEGDVLAATYGETPTVNGEPVDYENWPLFDGPFLQADKGSRKLEIRYGPMRRLLDFDTLTVTDWIDDASTDETRSKP